MTAEDALADVLRTAGCTRDTDVTITGRDPVLPTTYLIGAAGAAALAAVGSAASDLWHLRTGRRQRVRIDVRAAGVAMRSERYVRVNGEFVERYAAVSGYHRTRDARWIQLHCNFPHHRAGVLTLLGCPDDRAAVSAAVAQRDGQALENELIDAGLCAALLRSRGEWEAHPQYKAVAPLPLFEIIKLGDSRPEPLGAGATPLDGVRVLELTRVIAGPVSGRTLAQHGADVLRITPEHLPDLPGHEADTGSGKLTALLDLRVRDDLERLRALAATADVVTQGYRPGTLAARGLSPEALAAARPGIVCVTLSAWSHEGPWRERRGFDSLVQSTTGIVDTSGDRPRPLPAQVLDHVTGYLMAFGAMAALARRAREGGSYQVRVSLCQTQEWLNRLGRVDVDWRTIPDPTVDDVADLLIETDGPYGRVRHVRPVVELSETPAQWRRPAVPPGTSPPEWPPR
ncbi:MAG: CoA transferase [Candidatus Rokubacteria bacterium]|nr:CoA transferase [Candidatus Rokubacteria bacterium]